MGNLPGPKPRPGLAGVDYYMVGISRLEGFDRVIKLSSNESALGMSPTASAAARRAMKTGHLYPETDIGVLKQALGSRFGLDRNRIALGAGSDDLLARLVQTFAGPGDEVVHSRNAYMQFPIYAKRAGAIPVAAADNDMRHDVDRILDRVGGATRVVIVANPDNPSGTHLPHTEIKRLHEALPADVLLIVDSAYDEFATAGDYRPATHLVGRCSNVVVTRTFSKIFGLAGLRLGWCYAPEEIVGILEKTGPSFPASTPAQAAGLAALGDTEHADRVLRHTVKWRDAFSLAVREIGLVAYPSQTNFVLVGFPRSHGKTAEGADAFLQSRGIVARRFAVDDFRDKLRFTVGRATEMRKLIQALESYCRYPAV